jgi:hypothetical protein
MSYNQTILREIKQAKEESCLNRHLILGQNMMINLGYAQAEHQIGHPTRKFHPKEICLLDRLKNRKRQM